MDLSNENFLSVTDEFSKSMLISIPRKVKCLADLLVKTSNDLTNEDFSLYREGGQVGICSYSFDDDRASLIINQDDVVIIMIFNDEISVTDKRLCDVAQNLDWFTALEQSIYSDFTKSIKELETSGAQL